MIAWAMSFFWVRPSILAPHSSAFFFSSAGAHSHKLADLDGVGGVNAGSAFDYHSLWGIGGAEPVTAVSVIFWLRTSASILLVR